MEAIAVVVVTTSAAASQSVEVEAGDLLVIPVACNLMLACRFVELTKDSVEWTDCACVDAYWILAPFHRHHWAAAFGGRCLLA